MHIEMLKVFCDLSDLQSFSRTAEKHLLSQSAVSQQLAQLELAHKCQLINRKKRPIELRRCFSAVLEKLCKSAKSQNTFSISIYIISYPENLHYYY